MPAVQAGPLVDVVEVGLEDVVEDLMVVLVELLVVGFDETLVVVLDDFLVLVLDFDELRVEGSGKDLVLEGVMVIWIVNVRL